MSWSCRCGAAVRNALVVDEPPSLRTRGCDVDRPVLPAVVAFEPYYCGMFTACDILPTRCVLRFTFSFSDPVRCYLAPSFPFRAAFGPCAARFAVGWCFSCSAPAPPPPLLFPFSSFLSRPVGLFPCIYANKSRYFPIYEPRCSAEIRLTVKARRNGIE